MNTHLEPAAVPAPERPDGVVARRRSAYYAQVAAFAAQGLSTPPPFPRAQPSVASGAIARRDITLTA
ncbi:hypothetical protein GCM10025868_41390 [Angustibacter aerolatus]|uniref:Uncharacterized protein n=1 Tax=Angustibacter aerolatus TaxID=1162965 RepID=A0ABQ6JLW2_9ACTN|nr:hypothetical protein [Angustibacter aerolatus]GMA88889.1 hypothetical protein GCM10025868_41390 [Angustibacter aerolatus]